MDGDHNDGFCARLRCYLFLRISRADPTFSGPDVVFFEPWGRTIRCSHRLRVWSLLDFRFYGSDLAACVGGSRLFCRRLRDQMARSDQDGFFQVKRASSGCSSFKEEAPTTTKGMGKTEQPHRLQLPQALHSHYLRRNRWQHPQFPTKAYRLRNQSTLR